MTGTIEEYVKQVGATKDITLPSGAVFTIRKVQGRELIGINMPLTSKEELSGKISEDEVKLTIEEQQQQYNFCDKMIFLALVSPKFTEENIRDITTKDYEPLYQEIMIFSFGRLGAKSPLPEGS